ncbi:hypothetical protein PM076_03465 [Halorubrum ezzemoulense]|uniref:Uncharacterized protein n=1 Tax=Halorubrum ezzemoulense TaxID=337243 RepID=A0ABT4Z2Z2_HALEZ|nr:hypothetical protein [Halorubrum ezzemoulense]MDB2244512.1 hypothetical protein [Halorubrum ezzemoulense]MDB2278731.1 hypothetical protein [Halorubrum ezzemoulense]MDB2285793.1 hypothetical protein [Halorubrum ezzemoulense]MDB2287846.1 hypothetical protein [Halorubrum ezzemoulense]MDB2291971.1 hypothetical protein [Halorubrum ezzemoulense]
MSSTVSEYPVHERLDVQKASTVYKNADWWKAVILSESFGSAEVAIYLWQNDDGDWKRRQKLKVTSADEWESVRKTTESFVQEL